VQGPLSLPSEQGDRYLRMLLTHGAGSVLRAAAEMRFGHGNSEKRGFEGL
jgi:hypothetical protein